MVTHCVGEVNNMTSQGVTASGGGTGSPAASPSPTQIETAATTVQPQQRRPNENRRSNKPIMEKRRRARINNCLNELKSLILDAMKKDPARHSKLEKADILEMTVKHLENMQRQQIAMTAATDPQVLNKFRAGFSECAGEVGRFPGLEPPVRRRLLQHLANVLNTSTGTENGNLGNNCNGNNNNNTVSIQTNGQTLSTGTPTVQSAGVQVHILPATDVPQSGILFSTTSSGGGLQLVPTRLPNGDIALVLPSTNSTRQISTPSPNSQTISSTNTISTSPLPMLIPIPSRTSSTSSSTSSVTSDLSTMSSASQTTNTSTNSSTSPISFERLSVSTTPSPQPQSPPINHQQMSPYSHQNHHNHMSHQMQAYQPQNIHHSPVMRTSPETVDAHHFTPVDNQRITSPVPTPMISSLHQNQMSSNNYYPQTQSDMKPLSLVMKKKYPEVIVEDEKPWRPW